VRRLAPFADSAARTSKDLNADIETAEEFWRFEGFSLIH